MAAGDKQDDVEHLDMIIVGAGISGINTAYRVQTQLPHINFNILEARDEIGGTWDLFRYPGIRSDSDLHTFGFAWHPWPHQTTIAKGPLIMSYLKECVSVHGIDKRIHFSHHVNALDWSSKTARWTISATSDGRPKRFTARYIVLGTGYYDYKKPLQAEIPGIANFQGQVIHPQFWPEKFDHSDKKIVVIGSGATAITLIPSLAPKAASVTMLQRSPSYIIALPTESTEPSWMRRLLPPSVPQFIDWIWFMLLPQLLTILCQNFPNQMRALLRKATMSRLPPGMEFEPHFKPAYNPWDQRPCFSPGGDFFDALARSNTHVATGHIKTFSDRAVHLTDGQTIEADVVVTATGLHLVFAGAMVISTDGQKVNYADKYLWRTAMVQDLPNLFYMFGYTNASWTLGADNTAYLLCRIINSMQRNGDKVVTPKMPPDCQKTVQPRGWTLTSTYIKVAQHRLPRYGDKGPWKPRGNIWVDRYVSRHGNITDCLQFSP